MAKKIFQIWLSTILPIFSGRSQCNWKWLEICCHGTRQNMFNCLYIFHGALVSLCTLGCSSSYSLVKEENAKKIEIKRHEFRTKLTILLSTIYLFQYHPSAERMVFRTICIYFLHGNFIEKSWLVVFFFLTCETSKKYANP